MNTNTLRIGVLRTAAFTGLLLLGVVAGRVEAMASRPAPVTPPVRSLAELEPAVRLDLISKAAAAAVSAPRGFVLVVPATLLAPAL